MEVLKQFVKAAIQFASNWGELSIAFISLVIAIVALVKSSKAEKLQTRINEMELKLKEYEVAKMEQEQKEATLACVEARVISIGQGKHRLKVWNSGNAPAYNVVARFDGNPQIIMFGDEKQPFDVLEANKNYEIALITHGGSASKFKIITEWVDKNGNHQSKTQMGDL